MRRNVMTTIMAGAFLLMSANSYAGIYTNDLSRCLVRSTSSADKVLLIKWIFAAIAQDPSVKTMVNVSPRKLDTLNRKTAALFMRLVTHDCRTQSSKAMKYEGNAAMEKSFSVLGSVAARGLMTDPSVQKGMSGLTKYLDKKKLQQVVGTN